MSSSPAPTLPPLTLAVLVTETKTFTAVESAHWERTMYGVTDGKTIGTYIEAKFQKYLRDRYDFALGSAAKGIDFPELNIDLKVTSIKQPQSSCPYRSARQKIFGLGYSVLVFVYEKEDDPKTASARLQFKHSILVDAAQTADYQMTTGLIKILDNAGNADDLVAFMADKNLPVDDIEARKIADELLANPPKVGYLTISNAQQWRLQYARVIDKAGHTEGVHRIG